MQEVGEEQEYLDRETTEIRKLSDKGQKIPQDYLVRNILKFVMRSVDQSPGLIEVGIPIAD